MRLMSLKSLINVIIKGTVIFVAVFTSYYMVYHTH